MRSLAAIFVVLMIWSAGLLAFVSRVDRSTPAPDPPQADGLVVLTGASGERIDAALALLEAGKAKRLLISGVGRHVTRAELQVVTGADKGVFDCCVDLGFAAENTVGNGRETAQWARTNGFHTLILVTADYHMPRAHLELRASLPEAKVILYPIATDELKIGDWWKTGSGAERTIVEYSKYLAVLARETLLDLGPRARPKPAQAAAGTSR
jgi:uncharacterized SAM-binding protein YcdF (DUF218 family)